MSFQYIRPEFQGLMDNEAKTLALVKDMADTLEGIAANQLHTPYLYSIFLRALLAVKADSASNPTSPRQQLMNNDNAFLFNNTNGAQNTTGTSPYAGISPGLGLYTGTGEIPYDAVMDFQNPFMAGNLGAPSAATANMAPPPVPGSGTMGSFALSGGSTPAGLAAPQAYNSQSESMLNILNGGFWDSMLVPGTFLPSVCDLVLMWFRACGVGFSTTLEGLSGGMVYAPAGSAFISQFHSPIHSRVQSPRLGPPHPPVDGLEEKVHYGEGLAVDC